MSTTTQEESSRRMQQQRAIDRRSGRLVDLADRRLPDDSVNNLLEERMSTAQLSTLLGVALEARSPAEVHGWIAYQMGRRDTSYAWAAEGFGKGVLADLGQVRKLAKEAAKELGLDEKGYERQQLELALIRLYAGYLKRWFVARGGQRAKRK